MGYWNTVNSNLGVASINDARRALNIGRGAVMRLIADGQIATQRVGKRLVVVIGEEA